VTAAVGNAIRSKIGKPKNKTSMKRPARKRLMEAANLGRRTSCAALGEDHGDQPPRGRRGAEARTAARSRFNAALIPCRKIGERDWQNMMDVLLSLSGEYE
jgi:hypothetical protein